MQSRRLSSARSALLEQRAASMRSALTDSEARLWAAIRGRRLGVAFRRQVVIEGFIVDFLAPVCKLVVEVDGGYHHRRAKADARRDARLAQLGYRVVRVRAETVVTDLDAALARIQRQLGARE